MSGGVIRLFALITTFRNHRPISQYDGTNRNLSDVGRLACESQGEIHRLEFDRRDHGGGGGIRTHGGLHLTRFPSVPIRPLSHPSKDDAVAHQFRVEAIGERRLTSWR